MGTLRVSGTPMAAAMAVCASADERGWAVIVLDPTRAHFFDRLPGGYRVSRCGTAASLTRLLVGRRVERLCPACLGDRMRGVFA